MKHIPIVPDTQDIVVRALWSENQGLVALLGLCPLLAISTTVSVGLGLGLATTSVLTLSSTLISAIRWAVPAAVRLPVCVLVIASVVTAVELLLQLFAYRLYETIGLFMPLIITNCVILARAELFALRNNVRRSLLDGLGMGCGFSMVLVAVSALRELLGRGTLFARADLLLGPWAAQWKLVIFPDYQTVPIVLQAPGAFLALAVLIAFKNWLDTRLAVSSAR